MRIGLWIPTFAETTVAEADRTVADTAMRAERLGFESIWTVDHLLPSTGVHSRSWYDPLISLAHIAAVTESIELGTASLVAGVRHPFALAKQLASIAALAGPRVALGAGSGWLDREYELFGYSMGERRARTDECLCALRRLLDEGTVTFRGRYWSFTDAQLVPRPEWHIPILVGGGSRLPEAGSEYDVPVMAESVLSRIVRHDGWLAPCAGTEELTVRDLETVRDGVRKQARSEGGFRYAHVQWTYVVDTEDSERAVRDQIGAFRTLMGMHRSERHLAECYLTGSLEEIRARIRRLQDAGFDELIIGPVMGDPEQLELIAGVAFEAVRRSVSA